MVLAVTSTLLLALPTSGHAAAALPCSQGLHATLVDEAKRANNRIENDGGFTGIALIAQCGPIDVYGTDANTAQFQLTTSGPDAIQHFRFHVVANSLTRLMAVQDTISLDFEGLAGQGMNIYRYWPDMTRGKERIEVIGAGSTVLSVLAGRYGSSYVDPVGVVAVARPRPTWDPSYDSPPWYGGDYIEWTDSGSYNLCTEAFGLHAGSTQYLLTAGHCSARNNSPITGESWINAVYDGNSLIGSLSTVGSVVYNSLGGQIDSALIQVSSSNQEWNGWYTSAYVNQQRTQSRAVVGETVCTNGAFEGTICSGVVQQSGYLGCQTVSGWPKPWCELIQATDPNGNVITGEGDSGGGVIGLGPLQYSEGTLSLENPDGLSCPHWTWRGNVCSSTAYFTDLPFTISRMSSYYNTQFYVNT